MRHAILSNNVVDNIIIWDSSKNPEYTPNGNSILLGENTMVSVGWIYMDGKFIDPSEPPQSPE